ncbi:MAG: sigma-70 family RNA polymerase sigma factor [bacterium]|nr:sigma-70 family RNA polymerase sigma factor [bacterium]
MNEYVKKLWKESFKGFYKRHSRSLWFYIYKTCGDEHMADDILQEAFYRYLKAEPVKLNEFQQKAYLYKTAYRLIIDHIRRAKTERDHLAENLAQADEVYDAGKEREISMAMDMGKTFGLLKPKERNLLWLAYVEGYSHKEIARITESKEKSIKVQLFRIKKKFGGILRQKGYTGEEYYEQNQLPVRTGSIEGTYLR